MSAAELTETIASVDYVFGATTALAFRRVVRDMIEGRLTSSADADGDSENHA